MDIKKLLSLVAMCLLLLLFSSCVPQIPPPIGVWRSEYLNITLYITPDYQFPRGGRRYPGTYVVNDEEVKIFVNFGNERHFRIFGMSALQNGVLHGDYWLYGGRFRVVNNELRTTLWEAQGRFEEENIVFHRLEHYDPINPEDWFPSN